LARRGCRNRVDERVGKLGGSRLACRAARPAAGGGILGPGADCSTSEAQDGNRARAVARLLPSLMTRASGQIGKTGPRSSREVDQPLVAVERSSGHRPPHNPLIDCIVDKGQGRRPREGLRSLGDERAEGRLGILGDESTRIKLPARVRRASGKKRTPRSQLLHFRELDRLLQGGWPSDCSQPGLEAATVGPVATPSRHEGKRTRARRGSFPGQERCDRDRPGARAARRAAGWRLER